MFLAFVHPQVALQPDTFSATCECCWAFPSFAEERYRLLPPGELASQRLCKKTFALLLLPLAALS